MPMVPHRIPAATLCHNRCSSIHWNTIARFGLMVMVNPCICLHLDHTAGSDKPSTDLFASIFLIGADRDRIYLIAFALQGHNTAAVLCQRCLACLRRHCDRDLRTSLLWYNLVSDQSACCQLSSAALPTQFLLTYS